MEPASMGGYRPFMRVIENDSSPGSWEEHDGVNTPLRLSGSPLYDFSVKNTSATARATAP
jgi:hypothetical protein